MKDKIKHPAFAARLGQAIDGNIDVPPQHYGRLKWFCDRLAERGVKVNSETVRKWTAGETLPRHAAMRALAEILKVEEGWLTSGMEPGLTAKEKRTRNAMASGAVNLVAGFVQISGSKIAFPQDGDKVAKERHIDLYAIIQGAQYSIYVALVVDGKTSIPVAAQDCVIIAVEVVSGTNLAIYEMDWDSIEEFGSRRTGMYEVELASHAWRKIESFAERI